MLQVLKDKFRSLFGKGTLEEHQIPIEENAVATNTRVVRLGESLVFAGKCHGSVGVRYCLDYLQDAFDAKKSFKYDRPEYSNPSSTIAAGGDSAILIYTLIPRWTGEFLVREISDFRGDQTVLRETTVLVVV